MAICAIHQPNFFPWLGYFDKIKKADIFVFLDSVQYPKSSKSMGSWCNRVKLNVGGEGKWISCPVKREKGIQLIQNVFINNQMPWREEFLETLEANYKKALNYGEGRCFLEELTQFQTDSLADFNIQGIQLFSKYLGYQTKFVRQSSLPPMQERSNEMLIKICKHLKADTYLCGNGADGYQEDDRFADSGIKLLYQDFTPTCYGNEENFIPGLSVIDWLMHAKSPLNFKK
jgi:hypothetical protein